MPLIPLLKKPGPLANVPGAVLDNQRRPTVDRRAEIAGVGQLAESMRMPEVRGDFAAPYEALGAVGRAVSQAGNVLGALAIKKREAETDVQVAQADIALEDGYNAHLAWRETQPDTSGWEANLDDNLKKARTGIESNKALHPAARDMIRIRADSFQARSKGSLLKDSAKQAFRMAASMEEAAIVRDRENKNYDQAILRSKAAEEKGYRFPHETAALESVIAKEKEQDTKEAEKNEREMVFTQNLTAIQADPYGWEPPKGTDPLILGRLITQQRRQKAMISADTADFVADGIAGGAIKSNADIDAISSPGFGPAEKAKWKAVLEDNVDDRQKEFYRANAPAISAELDARIRAWSPESDEDRAEYRAIVEEKSKLPVGFREDLNDTLSRKKKAAEPEPDKYVQESGYDAIADSLRSGFFDATPVPIIESGDAAAVKEEKQKRITAIRNASNFKAASIRRAWAKEMKAPVKPTPDEGQAILSRLMAAPVTFTAPSLFPAGVTASPDDWKTRLGPYAGDPDPPLGSSDEPPLVGDPLPKSQQIPEWSN